MKNIQVKQPVRTTPHLQKVGTCLRCADDATKYNHCVWCGADFGSHNELTGHWLATACGRALVGVLRSHGIERF